MFPTATRHPVTGKLAIITLYSFRREPLGNAGNPLLKKRHHKKLKIHEI